MKELKVFTLDYSTWRCGAWSKNKLGEGATRLLNYEGFTCCLGQMECQLGRTMKEILGVPTPAALDKMVNIDEMEDDILIYKYYDKVDNVTLLRNTYFAGIAMGINDDEDTTPEEKITLLTELCKDNGIELKVINKPI